MFTPKSDKHLISPYNITPESNIRVTRIMERINKYRSLIVKQNLFVSTLGNVQKTELRMCTLIFGCKGLTKINKKTHNCQNTLELCANTHIYL